MGPKIREKAFWLAKLPVVAADSATNYQRYGWLLAPLWALICLIMLVDNVLCQRRLDLSLANK
jgi:hypothetical protein